MRYPKRSQYKYAKSRYRVRNWAAYEVGLRSRGDLTVWLSEDALDSWRAQPSGKPGGQRTYADIAIEAALTIRMVFHLPLRQTEGFLRSLAALPASAGLPQIGRSIYSSTVRGSGFTSAICENRLRTGLGGSFTSPSTLIQVRSSPRI